MIKHLVVMCAVVLAGCGPARLPGAPEVGKPCASGSVAECTTAADVAYCQDEKWVEFACDVRCSNNQTPKCEGRVSGAKIDTACHVEGGSACVGDTLVFCRRRTLPIDSQYAWTSDRECGAGKCREQGGEAFVAICVP